MRSVKFNPLVYNIFLDLPIIPFDCTFFSSTILSLLWSHSCQCYKLQCENNKEEKKRVGWFWRVMREWDKKTQQHMEEAEKELERRSKFLNSLIQKKKNKVTEQQQEQVKEQHDNDIKLKNIHVRACDMSLPLQKHAFQCACNHLDSMPSKKIDSKHLALSLKKVKLLLFFTFIQKVFFFVVEICFWVVIFDPWFEAFFVEIVCLYCFVFWCLYWFFYFFCSCFIDKLE